MLINKKTKYLRKTMKLVKSIHFISSRQNISKVLRGLIHLGVFVKYHTKEKKVTFCLTDDTNELEFIEKKISLDRKSLKILARKQRAVIDFSKKSFNCQEEYLLSVEDLYKNTLQVSGFNNTLTQILKPEQSSQLLYELSRYLRVKELNSFSEKWNLSNNQPDLINKILDVFLENHNDSHIGLVNINQQQVLLYFFKESAEHILDIDNPLLDKQFSIVLEHFIVLFQKFLKVVKIHHEHQTELSKGLKNVLKMFIQHDNNYSGVLQLVHNYDTQLYRELCLSLSTSLKSSEVALLNRNDMNMTYDNIVCKTTVDDSVKYCEISMVKILPYFSYLIQGHYEHGRDDFKKLLEKRLEKLLIGRFKHNVLIYHNRSECHISILSMYEEDLLLFLNILSKNLRILFLEFSSNQYQDSYQHINKLYMKNKLKLSYEKALSAVSISS